MASTTLLTMAKPLFFFPWFKCRIRHYWSPHTPPQVGAHLRHLHLHLLKRCNTTYSETGQLTGRTGLEVIDIVLRNSGTSFNLPHCSYKLYKQSFVNRCLLHDCYWHVLLCGTLYTIWFVIIFSPHNWMTFVHLNKRHVMLYVMLKHKTKLDGQCTWASEKSKLLDFIPS